MPDCSVTLPEVNKLQYVGQIYTTRLDVPPRDFREGFPGVTGRFEWFTIDYKARFWIEVPGKYTFLLVSDDGSALFVDEHKVVNNDCLHALLSASGSISLDGGIHELLVTYFQGPRWHVALQLFVQAPGSRKRRIFDTAEFKPPANPADWKYPNSNNIDVTMDLCKAQKRPKKLILRP